MKNNPVITSLIISILLFTGACSVISYFEEPCFREINRVIRNTPVELEGFYVSEFEVSSFVPCGCPVEPGYGQGYWLTSNPESGFSKAYQISSPTTDFTDPGFVVYLLFEGEVSDLGPHGHLGMYLREITVTKLLDVQQDGKCRFNE